MFSVLKRIPLTDNLKGNNKEVGLQRKKRQTMFPNPETIDQQNSLCMCQKGIQNTISANNDDMMQQQIMPVVSSQHQSPTQDNQNNELSKAERINKGFERMLQFVTVAGQIDNYLSDRARTFVQTLSKLTEDNNSKNCGHRRT